MQEKQLLTKQDNFFREDIMATVINQYQTAVPSTVKIDCSLRGTPTQVGTIQRKTDSWKRRVEAIHEIITLNIQLKYTHNNYTVTDYNKWAKKQEMHNVSYVEIIWNQILKEKKKKFSHGWITLKTQNRYWHKGQLVQVWTKTEANIYIPSLPKSLTDGGK